MEPGVFFKSIAAPPVRVDLDGELVHEIPLGDIQAAVSIALHRAFWRASKSKIKNAKAEDSYADAMLDSFGRVRVYPTAPGRNLAKISAYNVEPENELPEEARIVLKRELGLNVQSAADFIPAAYCPFVLREEEMELQTEPEEEAPQQEEAGEFYDPTALWDYEDEILEAGEDILDFDILESRETASVNTKQRAG